MTPLDTWMLILFLVTYIIEVSILIVAVNLMPEGAPWDGLWGGLWGELTKERVGRVAFPSARSVSRSSRVRRA